MGSDAAVNLDVLRQRLGRHAIGASRDVRKAAMAAAGEQLVAVAIALWKRRGWVVVATSTGLHLVRRPWLGRPGAHAFDWGELTAVEVGAQRVSLTFGPQEVHLHATGPHDEFVCLIEHARSLLHDAQRPSVHELRTLAKTKLGRFATFGFEASIDALPDLLEPEEHVERLAGASLEFDGLLVLTDRRLMLLDVTVRRSREQRWALARDAILTAAAVDGGIRLELRDGEHVTVTDFLPSERRDEFVAALR